MTARARFAPIFALLLALLALPVTAGEITCLCSQGVTGVMEALAPEFERATGDKLVMRFGVSQTIRKEIDEGAAFDVTILARDQLDALAAAGIVVPGSQKDVARSGIGIAIKAGAAKPDLSSAESFKKMLLDGHGVAFTSVGASGVYFQKLIEKFGIADAMQGKLHAQPSGRAAEQVARGDAQYAFQQISELLGVPGTELAGPLPPELQVYTSFSAGIGAKARNPAGAKALILFLTTPARAKLIESKGMQPG
jgi:molybdate transport system substrate-binding protein